MTRAYYMDSAASIQKTTLLEDEDHNFSLHVDEVGRKEVN